MWEIIDNSGKCTSSQEQVEEYLADCFVDTDPSAQLNLKSTQEESCCNDNEMECYHDSQSGIMLPPSMEGHGAEQLTLFAEDSPAKISQPREQIMAENSELKGVALACGLSMQESLMKYGLSLSLPKTPRILELTDLLPSSKTLPSWGMMLNGVSLELAMLVRITTERESGYLPTVLATDWKGGCIAIRKDRGTQRMDQWRDYVKIKYGMTYPHPTHSELRMGWPQNWTDLKPLAMDKFQKWRDSHGRC